MAKGKSTKSRAAKVEQTGEAGRPRVEIDLAIFEELAQIHCTKEEIAAVFRVSVDTIARRLESDPVFAEIYAKGRAEGKAAVRRTQYQWAKRGHPTHSIWWGKQHLGQRDKHELTGAEGGPIETREVARSLTTETLRRVLSELTSAREGDGATAASS